MFLMASQLLTPHPLQYVLQHMQLPEQRCKGLVVRVEPSCMHEPTLPDNISMRPDQAAEAG